MLSMEDVDGAEFLGANGYHKNALRWWLVYTSQATTGAGH